MINRINKEQEEAKFAEWIAEIRELGWQDTIDDFANELEADDKLMGILQKYVDDYMGGQFKVIKGKGQYLLRPTSLDLCIAIRTVKQFRTIRDDLQHELDRINSCWDMLMETAATTEQR
jgi:hypothetical protein